MTISAVDLVVILAIVHFCYLGTKLIEMIKQELRPEEHPMEEWMDEIRWKDL